MTESRLITIHLEDNKAILMAYRDQIQDHIYWSDCEDYRGILEEFLTENPEYNNCDIDILYN